MNQWKVMNDVEIDQIYDKMSKQLNYNFSNDLVFDIPYLFITFDISKVFEGKLSWTDNDDFLILDAINKCIKGNEIIYAIDEEHEYFIGTIVEELKTIDEIPISIFPDGDFYYIFDSNLKWGYLANPREESITIFGELVNNIIENKPGVFKNVIRKSI